jgi:hypothetical protein
MYYNSEPYTHVSESYRLISRELSGKLPIHHLFHLTALGVLAQSVEGVKVGAFSGITSLFFHRYFERKE